MSPAVNTRSRPRAAASPLTYELVRGADALRMLRVDWERIELSAPSQTGFQSWAWLDTFASSYSREAEHLCVLVGRRDGDAVMVWPLALEKSLGLVLLEGFGEPLSQYHDALVAGTEDLAGALHALSAAGADMLLFRRMRADSPVQPLLRAADARLLRREQAPFVDFTPYSDLAAFEASLSAKTRSNRRRRRRKLDQLGRIEVASADTPERSAEWIDVAMRFKREWATRHRRYAPAVFDPRFAGAIADFAAREENQSQLRVLAMLCDDRPIGAEISYGYRDRLFAHVLAPDPALDKYGVGAALADAAICDAFERGYRIYDLLAPGNPYKSDWTDLAVEVEDYLLPLSARGRWLAPLRAAFTDYARALGRRAPGALVNLLNHRRLDSVKSPR